MNATDTPDLFTEILMNLSMSHVEALRTGWNAQQVKINAIVAAYDKARADPNAKIPTYLHAAIEVARQ